MVYDSKNKKFIPCPSIREEPVQPSNQSLSMGGKLLYRFDQDTGLLEVGDEKLAAEIREQVSGDFWKGANIQIMLPFAKEPVELSGVKEIRYSKK